MRIIDIREIKIKNSSIMLYQTKTKTTFIQVSGL